MKKVLFILTCFFFFLIPRDALAIDYTIDKYHIDIVVGENNVLEITEDITANFNVYKHGIYRYIPQKNYVNRVDGSSSLVKAKVKKIKVDNEFDSYDVNDDKVIQIGSANYTVIGLNNYLISYSYDLGKDKNKNFDELYFNIIGTGWDTTLSNVTFTIHMPKDYDTSKFGLSLGEYGTSGTSDVEISFDGNTINGRVLRTINPSEALTTRIELEEGYFVRPLLSLIDISIIVGSSLLALISLFLWRKYGVDDEVVETVEFNPPEGLNSAEVGYIYNEQANDKQVVSLLVYLASKGYLKIQEEVDKSTSFIKLKDYDGNNDIERNFFNSLFKNKDKISQDSLKENFYTTVATIKFKLTKLRNKTYSKFSDNLRFLIGFFILLTIILTGAYYIVEDEVISLIILVFYFIFAVALSGNNEKGVSIVKMFIYLALVCISSSIIYFTSISSSFCIVNLFVLISLYLLILSIKYIPKRTMYGCELVGKIRGFRNFLDLAEKEKLEELVNENPEYFYDILPYAYSLNLSSKWIKKFESIAMMPPEWYSSYDNSIPLYELNDRLDSAILSTHRAMTYMPKSSLDSNSPFDGGSSDNWTSGGGGFSGGGSGGGGGGSW